MNLPKLTGAAVATMATLATVGSAMAAPSTPATSTSHSIASTSVRYKTALVDGVRIFYREAGNPDKPAILLLHGFPSSSHMFRYLIPLLEKDFHLIAPDYPGAGYSEAPGAEKFTASFDQLGKVMSGFIDAVGLTRFSIYMQDFGGPVGFRLAVTHPDQVDGLIIQNANAYVEGIAPPVYQSMKARSVLPLTAAQHAEVDELVSRETTKSNYLVDARDPAAISPDSYTFDSLVLDNPAARRIQRELLIDYHGNFGQYPRWHDYLRTRQPKTLILWGEKDPLFIPPGALAYKRDLPNAELSYLDAGHFALEEEAPEIARRIRATFGAR